MTHPFTHRNGLRTGGLREEGACILLTHRNGVTHTEEWIERRWDKGVGFYRIQRKNLFSYKKKNIWQYFAVNVIKLT